MEAFYYIYTATAANDYCSLVSPDSSFFNKEVKEHFIKRIRNLINTDAYGEGILNNPIWLLIKEGDLILWGVGCKTSELSNQTDDFGRTLRTFVGVFIKTRNTDNIELPYDMDFFKRAFEKIVLPQWNVYTNGITNQECKELEAREYISPRSSASQLNTNYHYCRAFNNKYTDTRTLFEQALGCGANISVASKVVDLRQVTNSNAGIIPLMNAVCSMSGEQYRDIQVEHECRKCGNKVYDLKDGICLSCWEDEHRPPVFQNTYMNKETHQKAQCNKCYREYDFVLSDGLCENCHDHELDRKWTRRIVIVVTLFFVVGIILFVIPQIRSCKPPKMERERIEVAPASLKTHKKDSMEDKRTDWKRGGAPTEVVDDPSFTDAVRENLHEEDEQNN